MRLWTHPGDPEPVDLEELGMVEVTIDYEAAWEVLSGGFDVPPISAKIMSQVAVDAALGITTEDDE